MEFSEILKYFIDAGAKCLVPEGDLKERLVNVDTFIFDWDGVFNRGEKSDSSGSPFAEPDSMGTNLMRLSYFLKNGELPRVGIMTGAQNEGADYFASREHFDFLIRGYTNKNVALQKLLDAFDIDPERTMFVWDDVLDLPVAKWAGVSCQVNRKASPILNYFTHQNRYAHYRTAFVGGDNAVREIAEVYLGAQGNATTCMTVRMEYGAQYHEYLALRNASKTVEIRNRN